MMPRTPWTRAALGLGALLGSACDKPTPPPSPAAGGAPASGAPSPTGGAETGPSSPASLASAAVSAPKPPAKGSDPKIGKAKLSAYATALAEGRKLAVDKKWAEAVTRFEEAVAARPGDPRALAELGYAQHHAGDDKKARETNQKALAAASDANLRAQILFNEGLVDEKLGDKEAARAHYLASYKLRANETVKKRLLAVGGLVGPCDGVFPTVEDIRGCLFTKALDDLGLPPAPGEKLGFQRKVEHPSMLLHVFKWGPGLDLDGGGGHPQLLIAKVPKGFRKVADLGSDYEPGAFGVHNEARFTGFADEAVGAHKIVKVSWEQADVDANMAGLQTYSLLTRNVTLCVLGDAQHETTCPVTVPIEEVDELTYMEGLTGEDKDAVDEVQKSEPPYKKVSSATFTIGADGTVKAKETAGKRKALEPLVAGVKLF